MSGTTLTVLPTRQSWIDAAIADLPTLLIDHAHCERKAANTALRFMSKFPNRESARLSKLAREELVHYEQVLRELEHRGIPFGHLPSANYAQQLFAAVRPNGEARQLDEFLCCALIEARSHERFVALAAAVDDQRLRALYETLLDAEARHGELYLDLAAAVDAAELPTRLSALRQHEDAVVHRPSQPLRMHAGG